MRLLAIPVQFMLAGAAAGLAFSLSALPAQDSAVLVVRTAPVNLAGQGEAAPRPVDLDGDGMDDSGTFAAAILAEETGHPVAAANSADALVLRRVHIVCPHPAHERPVTAAAASTKETPWILLATGSDGLPNAIGTRLRVRAPLGEARPVLIENGEAPDDPAYVRAVAESCAPPPVVS
jgi:hypothetical protein